jgi:LmbE family N-acetylglucosaminyl deacetylase
VLLLTLMMKCLALVEHWHGMPVVGNDDIEVADEEIEQRRRHAKNACDELGVSVSFHSFPDNSFDTAPLLDIIQTIEKEIEDTNPDIVYTHHYGDLNVDHELTCRATVTATRPLQDSNVKRVLAFETLSATEWAVPKSGNEFQPTSFISIEDSLETNSTMMKNCVSLHILERLRLFRKTPKCGALKSELQQRNHLNYSERFNTELFNQRIASGIAYRFVPSHQKIQSTVCASQLILVYTLLWSQSDLCN